MQTINFKDTDQLRQHLKQGQPTLYTGSQTSTVIPYDNLDSLNPNYSIGNLSNLPKKMEITSSGDLKISGSISWLEAKQFCQSNDRKIMTSPTEELALCLSGIATSATGERCFKFGTIRDQIVDITFLDHEGAEHTLRSDAPIEGHELFSSSENSKLLKNYQSSYLPYKEFKNAPFPALKQQTDLMIGTEGQLGVITSATFKTTNPSNEMYVFLKLPRWEKGFEAHKEIVEKVQGFKDVVDVLRIYRRELPKLLT